MSNNEKRDCLACVSASHHKLNCWETAAFAEKEIKMSHSEAVRVAPMDLSFSQAVVCGPRTKLDFGERLFINPRERHMDARHFILRCDNTLDVGQRSIHFVLLQCYLTVQNFL